MAIDFGKFESSELEMLLESVSDFKLKKQIRKELTRRELLTKYAIQEQFRSERLPDFNSEYLYKCNQLALEFNFEQVPLLWKAACFDSNNNIKGDFYVGIFGSDKSELDQKWMHNLGYMSLLFQDEDLRQRYEGTYNTVNYMLNGIYRELNRCNGEVDSVSQLFSEMSEKKEIVKEKFSDVVEYLWTVRSDVINSRSSISNHGLTMNRGKTKKHLTVPQKALIEAVAFGCNMGELESGNYEGAKRLIYVPSEKMF